MSQVLLFTPLLNDTDIKIKSFQQLEGVLIKTLVYGFFKKVNGCTISSLICCHFNTVIRALVGFTKFV